MIKMAGAENSILKKLEFGSTPKSRAGDSNPLYKKIPDTTSPKEVTEKMRLVFVRGDFSKAVQGKTLHYSGYFNRILKPSLQKDLSVMAIWQRGEWCVIAWVDES